LSVAKQSGPLAVNDRVSHPIYGLGTVTEATPTRTTIEFDESGRRKFVTDLVQLERTTVAAPAPPPKKARAKKPASKPAK
jgi:hypothetical protein